MTAEVDLTALLSELTQVVRRYGLEQRRAPKTLGELVTGGYLNAVPSAPAGADANCVQISRASTLNYGAAAYGLHGRRFNYLFHDGHVAIHRTADTVGTGTTNSPKGMWTMLAGD